MNILFIYSYDLHVTEKPLLTIEEMHFGISYISSFLKKHEHKTKLLILSEYSGEQNFKLLESYINDFIPDLICFTSIATQYKFLSKIAKYLKEKHPGIFLLIGGVHASLNAEETIKDDFDAVCLGEGEYSVWELVTQLEQKKTPTKIQNLWIKKTNGIEKNPNRPFIEDLNILPFPDIDIWIPWLNKTPEKHNGITILLGRGCPFMCTYCCNHALKKLAQGNYVRFRSAENIIKEIKEINNKYPNIQNIYLEVETIGVNIKWAEDFCHELGKFNKSIDNQISYRVNLRIIPNMDYDNLFDIFKKANINHLNIGLESGSERVRKEILNRNYSNEDIINTVKIARKYGLKVTFYNLMGLPGETEKDFLETIRINKICQPDHYYLSIFYPYPGTDLHKICNKRALLKNINTTRERVHGILNLPEFPNNRVDHNYIWFDYNIYKDNKPLYKTLQVALKRKILVTTFTYNIVKKIASFMMNFF